MKLEINSEELLRLLDEKGNVEFVDVREESEERIANFPCLFAPLSRFSEEAEHLPQDKILILFCRGGFRSLRAAEYLHIQRPEQEIYSLEGGFSSLIEAF